MMAIGGTGMLALAGFLKTAGHEVAGCDGPLYPPMSDYAAKYGIEPLQGHDPSHLDPPPDLVVVGNAIHCANPEAVAVVEGGIPYISMAEAIGRFCIGERKSLTVAGTHGKTTTTALCGYLLERAGLAPRMIVGGIARDFDSSYLAGGGEWCVLEGDEYETAFFDKGPKFLHYRPDILLLNNIEMDHLDNFRDLAHLENAFVRLFGAVAEDGCIVAGIESEPVRRLLPQAGRDVVTFGIAGDEDATAREITFSRNGSRFRFHLNGKELGEFASPLHGFHNLRNAVGALAACLRAGAEVGDLRRALPGFQSVKRRQEVAFDGGGVVVVDDFAHHPTAIFETLTALVQRFEPKRVVACFEPRSYTCQTNLHQDVLAGAFSSADLILLGPLKPSQKIPPEKRLDLAGVKRDLGAIGKRVELLETADEYLDFLGREVRPGDLVAFFSSGSFMDLPARLARQLGACGG
jgi:UDP-N-acetylmuramate: L-alanyl-gamma-D-glutamyl-meso-diaminopimelate ligase